uniref:SF1B family DNA helicase RecD2 n=1 Tax=Lachnoclostridium phocaeense TaxID=1871021 RepID=UPI0026DB6788|nr:AAA family ATPase [Lachnoclostridium phocaeense]
MSHDRSFASENDLAIQKNGDSVFYGYFNGYIWRNEKTGNCFFRVCTKQDLFLEEFYSRKIVRKNRVTQNAETWYTVSCDGTHTVVPFYALNTPIRMTGHFVTGADRGYGWEFMVTDIEEAAAEEALTIEFLAGNSFQGVKYADAVDIVKNHGADIFEFVKKKDASVILQKETGLSAQVIEHMVNTIKRTVLERELYMFLAPYHVSYAAILKGIKKWGDQAILEFHKDPYAAGKALGISFSICDKLAKTENLSSQFEGRIHRATMDVLETLENNGHTWIEEESFFRLFERKVSTDAYPGKPRLSAMLPVMRSDIVFGGNSQTSIVYGKLINQAERRIADNIKRITLASHYSDPTYFDGLVDIVQNECQIQYGHEQRSGVQCVLSKGGIKILTGGPGTGKTTVIKGIIYAYRKMHPEGIIKLCAPTGRAAQRMSEATGFEATTVHRLLDYRPYGNELAHKDEFDQIEADFIVIDEMSMMDTWLFDKLLRAAKSETRILLVGDIHQLESVGAGSILHDLLASAGNAIDTCMLHEVFRQKGDSSIIGNALMINRGLSSLSEAPDFQIIQTDSPQETLDQVQKLLIKYYNPFDPFETQVLCPAREGVSGVNNINIVGQSLLNPGKKGLTYGSIQFRKNDKILMMHNNYDPDRNYYNGDIGIVKDIQESGLDVEIRGISMHITRDIMDDMRLAYAMTIHKSQGSEFKNVIVVMPEEPRTMLVRNLIYTAVTRAKKQVIILNERHAMEQAIQTDRSGQRRTNLQQYMRDVLK